MVSGNTNINGNLVDGHYEFKATPHDLNKLVSKNSSIYIVLAKYKEEQDHTLRELGESEFEKQNYNDKFYEFARVMVAMFREEHAITYNHAMDEFDYPDFDEYYEEKFK